MHYKKIVQIAAALFPLVDLTVARSVLPSRSEWQTWNSNSKSDKAKAIYLMTNKGSNSIVALNLAQDGTIASVAGLTATGGAGGNTVDATKFTPNAPDALGSQGALGIADNFLFAVNAGSNTVSMFKISESDPSKLTLVGKPTWTGGDFPNTLAVSQKLGCVCVGNSGINRGISCASYDPVKGLGTFDGLRALTPGKTNPPTGPADGISDVFFVEDDSKLVLTVKGNGTEADPGFIGIYAVDQTSGKVSYESTTGSPAGADFIFGSVPIPGTSLIFASDAGFGSFTIDLNNLATPVAATNITNGKAPCWAAISSLTGTGFIADVIVSQSVEVDLKTGAIVSSVPCNNNGQGLTDLEAVGSRLYALAPGNGTVPAAVTVFDLSGGRGGQKAIQNFVIAEADLNAAGLAIFS